jgi:hypothetical protein
MTKSTVTGIFTFERAGMIRRTGRSSLRDMA